MINEKELRKKLYWLNIEYMSLLDDLTEERILYKRLDGRLDIDMKLSQCLADDWTKKLNHFRDLLSEIDPNWQEGGKE